MSKTWTFIGGVITGIIGVFAAATAAVALEEKCKTDVVLDEGGENGLPVNDENNSLESTEPA